VQAEAGHAAVGVDIQADVVVGLASMRTNLMAGCGLEFDAWEELEPGAFLVGFGDSGVASGQGGPAGSVALK